MFEVTTLQGANRTCLVRYWIIWSAVHTRTQVLLPTMSHLVYACTHRAYLKYGCGTLCIHYTTHRTTLTLATYTVFGCYCIGFINAYRLASWVGLVQENLPSLCPCSGSLRQWAEPSWLTTLTLLIMVWMTWGQRSPSSHKYVIWRSRMNRSIKRLNYNRDSLQSELTVDCHHNLGPGLVFGYLEDEPWPLWFILWWWGVVCIGKCSPEDICLRLGGETPTPCCWRWREPEVCC